MYVRMYLQADHKRMSYFSQYIALVFDMFNLLEADDFGHGQDFHGTVFFGNTIATETNTSKGASSWKREGVKFK